MVRYGSLKDRDIMHHFTVTFIDKRGVIKKVCTERVPNAKAAIKAINEDYDVKEVLSTHLAQY